MRHILGGSASVRAELDAGSMRLSILQQRDQPREGAPKTLDAANLRLSIKLSGPAAVDDPIVLGDFSKAESENAARPRQRKVSQMPRPNARR